jgi:hypothetical protein
VHILVTSSALFTHGKLTMVAKFIVDDAQKIKQRSKKSKKTKGKKKRATLPHKQADDEGKIKDEVGASESKRDDHKEADELLVATMGPLSVEIAGKGAAQSSVCITKGLLKKLGFQTFWPGFAIRVLSGAEFERDGVSKKLAVTFGGRIDLQISESWAAHC